MTHCPLCNSGATRHLTLVHTSVWECAAPDCGLEFAVPQLDKEALARAYADCYYPAVANGQKIRYGSTPDIVLRQMFLQLQSQIGLLEGLGMLDYGCGRGALSRIGQEFGLITAGIEPDPNARSIAASIPRMMVYPNVAELREAKPTGQFDLIILWTVIEHLRRPWSDLEQLRGLLRPGGWLLVSTMNIRCLRARLERERWENYENPTHFYYFNRKSLNGVLRAAGFTEVCEWKPKIRYPHHGMLRRWLYNISYLLGLSDGLYYIYINSNSRSGARSCDSTGR